MQDWSAWPAAPAADRPTQLVTSCEMRAANRRDNPWTRWTRELQARELQASRPERSDESRWKSDVGGTNTSYQSWSSSGSCWSRPSTWATPTSSNLTGPDYSTDREWQESRRGYTSGWENDPSYRSQSKRAKPTHTDPEET